MKIILKNKEISHAQIGKHDIRVLSGLITISQQEWEDFKEFIFKIWKKLQPFDKSYTGFARLDLFMNSERKKPIINSSLDYGLCDNIQIIEFNCGSPECAATTSVIRSSCSHILPATEILAESIRKSFGYDITFVAGKGMLKELTVSSFIQDLKKILNLEVCTEEDIIMDKYHNNVIWAWGDIKPNLEHCEFSQEFIQRLREIQKKGIQVFNSFDSKLASKATLFQSGLVDGCIVDERNISKLLSGEKEMVFKPLFGSGGSNIFFSEKVRNGGLKNFIEKIKGEEYGAFEYYNPPKIFIPEQGWFTYDWNPALWIENGQLKKILYIVVRMNPLETFKGIHNVSGGGSYGGIVKIE